MDHERKKERKEKGRKDSSYPGNYRQIPLHRRYTFLSTVVENARVTKVPNEKYFINDSTYSMQPPLDYSLFLSHRWVHGHGHGHEHADAPTHAHAGTGVINNSFRTHVRKFRDAFHCPEDDDASCNLKSGKEKRKKILSGGREMRNVLSLSLCSFIFVRRTKRRRREGRKDA